MTFRLVNNKFISSLIIVFSFINFIDSLVLNKVLSETNKEDANLTLFGNEIPSDLKERRMYILGSGDILAIRISRLEELSGLFLIRPDGFLYLPEIKAFSASGMTLEQLKIYLKNAYKDILINPEVEVIISSYKPISIFVKGEVEKPGLYLLGGDKKTINPVKEMFLQKDFVPRPGVENIFEEKTFFSFPTLFDALKVANGITLYSKLSDVKIVRKIPDYYGGGKMSVKLDVLKLLLDGDQSQNINLLDGDTIIVPKSDEVLIEQMIQAKRTNISPDEISVYVSGNVKVQNPLLKLKQGTGLNQAIAIAGGQNILSGKIRLLRMNKNGDLEKKSIKFNSQAELNTPANPVLSNGDIIYVDDSLIGDAGALIEKITKPISGIFQVYFLLDRI